MKKLKLYLLVVIVILLQVSPKNSAAQRNSNETQTLGSREQHIVTISSFTAKGNLERLKQALNSGLEAGLTVNEIKEVLVHLYAYCGFPRSIQGINTFMAVLDERKAKGIIDKPGRESTAMITSFSKYERGKEALETLTGQPEREPKTGYAAFSPVIDTFLKEHLFADIFGRDILSYSEREIATISALISIGGVEPMMQGHFRIALNLGITEADLIRMLALIEERIGKEEADAGRRVLSAVTNTGDRKNNADTSRKPNNIFSKGVRAPVTNFTGAVWVNMVVQAQDQLDCNIGTVTFEPGSRTNWHSHPGGQVLLVTEGRGYYQEKGQPIKILKKGDVVKCPARIEHWHGASPDDHLTHIAISTNAEKGNAVWLKKVTDEEYMSFK